MQRERMPIEGAAPKPYTVYWNDDNIGSRDTAAELIELVREHKRGALCRKGKYTVTHLRKPITMVQLRHLAEDEKLRS